MVGLWRGSPFSRLRCAGVEMHHDHEESDALLTNYKTEKGTLPRTAHFVIPELDSADTAQQSVRYVSFGIGGAGNIRRWVLGIGLPTNLGSCSLYWESLMVSCTNPSQSLHSKRSLLRSRQATSWTER